jgi:hypothetical protein
MKTFGGWISVVSILATLDSVQPAKTAQPPERPQLVRDALERNRPIYYFGLGSNMSRKKLENRGVNGTKIGILTMEAGFIPRYRLAFNLRGFPPIEPGMGSLEPVDAKSKALLAYEHEECHGALVKLSPENYEKVMRSEGVGGDSNDPAYEEIVVDVYPYKRPGKPVKAVALRARPHARLSYDPCPSTRYMKILKEGAKELGLKTCYQDFLARHPVQAMTGWQKKEAIYNLIFTWSLSSTLKWRGISMFQSRLLYLFYALPSAPVGVRVFNDFVTAVILLPGALFGYLFFHIWRLTGKTPPFVTRIISLFADSD